MPSGLSMSKRSSQVLCLAGALLLGIGHSQAQLTEPQPQPTVNDPFGAFHSSLSKAVDRALTDPVRAAEAPRSEVPSSPAPMAATDRKARAPVAAGNRVQQLRPIIEPILREEQVPTDLAAIVLVESAGQSNALSPKGARGLWQFMPSTARRYGLTVTSERDERLDVYKSTRAAAHYLHDLRNQFGDWRLVFAAYNAGGETVQRAIERNGAKDFAALSGRRLLPLETRKYVPAVLEAIRTFGNADGMVVRAGDVSTTWILYAEARVAKGGNK